MPIILSSTQGQNKQVSAGNRRQKYPSHTYGHWFREVFPSPHQGWVRCWMLQPDIEDPTVIFFLKEDQLRVWKGTYTGFLPHFLQSTSELHFTLLLCISCSAFLTLLLLKVQHLFCVKGYTLHFIVHKGIRTKGFILYYAGNPLFVFISIVPLK